MTREEENAAMLAKGYVYIVEFKDGKPEPLYLKSLFFPGEGFKLLRETYPDREYQITKLCSGRVL